MDIMPSVKSIFPVLITFFIVYVLVYLFAPAVFLERYVLAFEAYDFLTFLGGFSRAPFLLTPGYELSTILTWIISGAVLGFFSKKNKALIINSLILVLLIFMLSQLNIFLYNFSFENLIMSVQQWIVPIIASLFITNIAGLVGVSLSGESPEEDNKTNSQGHTIKQESSGISTPKIEDVISTKVCPHCGSIISSTVTYCPYCGKKV